MKWRHWSILIVLLLLNYLIFSAALTQLARQKQVGALPTRTPQPTYATVSAAQMTWIIAPTNTPWPTYAGPELEPTAVTTAAITASLPVSLPTNAIPEPAVLPGVATELPTPGPASLPTDLPATAAPPTATPQTTIHVVQRGETLNAIAARYGVSLNAIVRANGITNPNLIYPGQKLVIPAPGQPVPSVTPRPPQTAAPQPTRAATRQPTATATQKPPAPTATQAGQQFTAEVVWRPEVAPNCAGPAISNLSVIRDAAGNPVNGVVVEVDCYGNVWALLPSGKAGVYEPGHYDWSPGQPSPVDWTCTARVVSIDGQPVGASQEVSIHFDTNTCKPGGSGHQVAILNWTKWR